jgi:hypothetical protein
MAYRIEGITRKETSFGEVKLKVYGYLVNILAGTTTLLPYVFQIRTGYEYKIIIANNFV